MSRAVYVICPAIPLLDGSPALTFAKISGTEALSELSEYKLELKTPDSDNPLHGPAANLNLKSFIGQECTLEIALDGKGTGSEAGIGSGIREISGVITQARILRKERRSIVYELVLRPWFWLATRNRDYRLFQEKSVVDILTEILGTYAFPVKNLLAGSYPAREYQVQYGESDFVFLQRLMQEWGIYWYVEHSEHKHRLVLCDHASAHAPFTSPAYHDLSYFPSGSKIDEEHVSSFELVESLTSGAFVTGDFNFTNPRTDLTVISRQPRDTLCASYEVYEWPGDFETQGLGEQLARRRMEQCRSGGSLAYGVGNLKGVVTGCTFSLNNHPHTAANGQYLISRADFEMEDIGEETGFRQYRYEVRFQAHPESEPYRPPRTIPKPRTRGPQTAIVTGPEGQDIWTDKYGRVKVKFHWDRYGGRNENASCWIRVAHPWAGENFGVMHIPRVGQEVIVDFLHGDPDLPLITGSLYNAANMPPWPLPTSSTQSGFLSRSTKNGREATANALRFEDKKDNEEIWLHAEKDQRIEVENDESCWVGNDRRRIVDHDETVGIGHDYSQMVDNDAKLNVKRDRMRQVGRNESIQVAVNKTTSVGQDEQQMVGRDQSVGVGRNKTESVGEDCMMSIGGAMLCTVKKNSLTTVEEDMNTSVQKNASLSVSETYSVNVAKNYEMSVKEDTTITCEGDTKQGIKKGLHIEAGETVQIVCGDSSLTMDKKGNIVLKGKDIQVEASGEQLIKAAKNITLKGQKILEN